VPRWMELIKTELIGMECGWEIGGTGSGDICTGDYRGEPEDTVKLSQISKGMISIVYYSLIKGLGKTVIGG
jgi:hypothetical protein